MAVDSSSFPTSLDTWDDPLSNGSSEIIAERIRKLNSAITKLETKIGVDNSTVTTSHTYRINGLRGWRLYAPEFGFATGNTAAANSTAMNVMVTLANLGPVEIVIPAGTYNVNTTTVTQNYVTIRGAGMFATILNYQGSSAGASAFYFQGADGARTQNCNISDLQIYNSGNSDSIGVRYFGGTHHWLHRVNLTGFRRHAIKGGNFADSWVHDCTFDFCGSADDSDYAIIHFDDDGSAEWGVDEIHFHGCRFENISDRILFCDGATMSVAKLRFVDCKFESSTLDGNGLSGTTSSFELQSVHGSSFIGCDFTLQGLQGGTHAIIPAMFRLDGCLGITFSDCYWANGSVGAYKPYTTFFDCDGTGSTNYGLAWSNCFFATFNASAPPTYVWTWTGTNAKVGRINCDWAYVQGGGSPSLDSGSPTSASTY